MSQAPEAPEARDAREKIASLPPLPSHPRVVGSVLDLIGDTSFFELRRIDADSPRGRVFGKAEQQNPGGSVKDGIGLAIVCAAKGYRCILAMPASMSLERRQLLEAYGAEVILTEPERQMEGAIEKVAELAKETPNAFIPSQFDNPENVHVHRDTTAREILHAMANERLDAFVAGVGTGGTVSGVGAVLKKLRPSARIIAVEPEACATISRGERGPTKIQGLAPGFVPKNYDPSVVDEVRTVSDRAAYDTKVLLAKREGLLVGISAGATVRVALDVARELGPKANVVTMLFDTGERYFSLDEYFT
jgi:cysteine synthase A